MLYEIAQTAFAVYAVGCAAAFMLACLQGGTERDDTPFEWRIRFGIALLWPLIIAVAIREMIRHAR